MDTASPHGELHPALARWERNAGAVVSLRRAPAAGAVRAVDVLSWNLAIGAARLQEVVDLLRDGRWGEPTGVPERPLVVLAQEVFRADSSIPERGEARFHGGRLRGAERADIVHFAERNGWDLRYAPSMRNGAERSDRGNAVLASASLGPLRAWTLPLARQRRVAVSAELQGLPGVLWASAHLDTRGRLRAASRESGRVAQAASLARQLAATGSDVVLGADLNTPLGRRDAAFRALAAAGFVAALRTGCWRHTFHGPILLPLDHLLSRSPSGRIRGVEVVRLDEHPRDRGVRVWGSDHHPLLARVSLAPV